MVIITTSGEDFVLFCFCFFKEGIYSPGTRHLEILDHVSVAETEYLGLELYFQTYSQPANMILWFIQ